MKIFKNHYGLSLTVIVLIFYGTAFLFPINALAADTGWVIAGTGANVDGAGTIAWADPTNIEADDGAYSTSELNRLITEDLQATNFGFSIPAGATIDGVEVKIEKHQAGVPSNLTTDQEVYLIIGGSKDTNENKADTVTVWEASATAVTYGGSADLWSTSISAAQVNASNFGVSLAADGGDGNNPTLAGADYISIKIHYTAITGWNFAGTGAGTTTSPFDSGDVTWVNPTNIYADDNANADYSFNGVNSSSDGLQATNFGFTSGDVPEGSVIDGIEFRTRLYSDKDYITDWEFARIIKGGVIGTDTGNDGGVGNLWPISEVATTTGGATDKWGETWTQADIVSSDFGFALSTFFSAPVTYENYVDSVEARVYYTAGAPAVVLDKRIIFFD